MINFQRSKSYSLVFELTMLKKKKKTKTAINEKKVKML